jgi:hypothetical protein
VLKGYYLGMQSASIDGARTPRLQVRHYLPEKQRYTVELLEPRAGGGGQRMDVRPVNFVLAHLPTGTRCARAGRLRFLPPLQSSVPLTG